MKAGLSVNIILKIEILLSRAGYFLSEFYPFLIIDAIVFILAVVIFFRKKILASAICAAILFFCINFTLLEVYFRFIYDSSDGLGFLKVNQKWHERHVRVNGDFRRDEEFKLKKTAGVARICALGDSITFGYGIENTEDRYTEILEKTLKKNGYDAEIYNLAVSGVNTRDEISTYREYKFLNCDIILHQYALNDIRNNEDQAKLLEQNYKSPPLIKKVQEHSYFFDFIYWRLNQRYQNSFRRLQEFDFKDYEDPQKLKRHLAEISEYIQEVKSDGKEIIFVIFPMFYVPLDNNYPAWIHALMEAYFTKEGAPAVDLLPLAIGKDEAVLRASKFDAHPNEYFHNLAAQRIYEPLRELIKR